MLDYLSDKHCIDCGTEDIRVLEFDHTGNDKVDNVSKMMSVGVKLERILNEIRKCDIVCCNCHRIRTLTRSNSYRVSRMFDSYRRDQERKL